MKKTLQITTLFFIIISIALNSLFAFVLFYNRNYVHLNKVELLLKNNFIDIETTLLHKNTNVIKWIDDEELQIAGNYFDVLKIEKISENKSRVYIYNDELETGITNKIQDEEFHKDPNKKTEQSIFSYLLELKSYTKDHAFDVLLTAQDLIYSDLCINTEEGHYELLFHPPSV